MCRGVDAKARLKNEPPHGGLNRAAGRTGDDEMGTSRDALARGPNYQQPPGNKTVDEIRALRRELSALRRLFDEFAGSYLNAKFPFGRPHDRWRARHG